MASPEDRSGALAPPPDFVVPPAADLRECPWWRPVRVAYAADDTGDSLLGSFLPDLLDAFRAHGHHVEPVPGEDPDIVLACASLPSGPGPLRDRIEERRRPLLINAQTEFGLAKRPPHLVTLVGAADRVSALDHGAAVEVARVAMARLGTPKLVFVGGDRASGVVQEATVCTLEGGHPTVTSDHAAQVRDRLVAAACAREVGGDYETVNDGLSEPAWRSSPVPDAIVKAGRRMDDLGLLPPPQRVSEYVSPRIGALYERLLGIKGFSEGMLFAFDPGTQTLMVTASGSWDVDKRALRRDEVVPLDARTDERPLQVLAPAGTDPKGPSVEAYEMLTLLHAVPRIRLAQTSAGDWRPDPAGTVEAPIVRAGIHVHVGIEAIDPERIESLPANRRLFPYGFGCGTDLMHEVVRDVGERSEAMNDPDDPRAFVRWPMLYHGDTLVELWSPQAAQQPLEALLDLFEDGGIRYTPEHIEQPL